MQLDSLDDLVQQGLDGGDQGFQRLASVGNRILLGRSHFGAGQRLAFMVRLSADATGRLIVRDEQRIVTETVFATSLADDATRHVAEPLSPT